MIRLRRQLSGAYGRDFSLHSTTQHLENAVKSPRLTTRLATEPYRRAASPDIA